MKRRARFVTAFLPFLLTVLAAGSAVGLEEADRLWLVGEQATADGMAPVARRALERFVEQFPQDKRLPQAVLLLGRARLATGDADGALEAFRRAQTFQPAPGRSQETKFWEAEALFRLRRFTEARDTYDSVIRQDAASPLAPDALYGFAFTEAELGRPESAAKALREFLQTWPDHALVPSVTYQLARALVDLSRFKEAAPLLEPFARRYPGHRLVPDVQFLLGWARVQGGDLKAGVADLRAFVEANPKHEQVPAARRLLTETLARHGGDRSDMQETYKALMAQSPPTPESLSDAASIAGKLKQPREQEAAWRRLRTEFPDHVLAQRASLDLADAAFRRKDWTEAASLAQAATASTDDALRVDAWLIAGEAELKLRRFPSAEKAFKAASEIKNADPGLHYRALAGLGLAHEEQREWKLALAAYESVAARSPDATLRDWARQRVQSVKGRLAAPPNDKAPAPAEKKPAPADKKPAEKPADKKARPAS
jgi:TolA-binding protein